MTLRTRIFSSFFLVLVLVVGLATTVVVAQHSQLERQLDRRLDAIAPLKRPAPSPTPASAAGPITPESPISDIYIGTVRPDGSIESRVEGQLLNQPPDLSRFVDTKLRTKTYMTVSSTDGSTRFRALAEPVANADDIVVIAIPTTDLEQTIRQLILTFIVVTMLVMGVLGFVVWWIVRLGLRPISEITETALAISGGEQSRRSSEIDKRTEAGQLAIAFNLMLDQRDAAEARLRRFASDASHELRTPLTSIRGYLDLYSEGGFRDPGQTDDIVRRMRDEAHRMGNLVEDLLLLARFDETPTLEIEAVDLGNLAVDVVTDARARHPNRTIDVESAHQGVTTARIDRMRIKQLLVLLVDNATIHAPEAHILVSTNMASAGTVIVVTDEGPGLDPEHASQIFRRFYRGDLSRSRTIGGSGLGLSIAQSIVDAHDGTIELQTALGKGCQFIVKIPIVPADLSTVHSSSRTR